VNIAKKLIGVGAIAIASAAMLGSTAAAALTSTGADQMAARQGTRNHPTVFAARANGTSSSPYRHGRLYIARGGPSAWLSHPHFIRWNATKARATGHLWGADADTFSLGRHVTLVFSHTRTRMGYYWFSRLDIIGSHGVNRHWHMSRPSPRGSTWVPGK
jgi:hypothetical protein